MLKGIGCDIVDIERIAGNHDLAKRVLTERELIVYNSVSGHRKDEYLAGRFAAKEAVFKAISDPESTISKIEISTGDNGEPVCNIPGVLVSIAHEKNTAIAYAVYQQKEG